jgi:hypothetical protein
MSDNYKLWEAIYRAICLVKSAIEKYLDEYKKCG